MNLEANHDLVRRVFDFFNGKGTASREVFFSDSFSFHEPDDPIHGFDGVEKLRAGLPDLRYSLDDIFAEGDKSLRTGRGAARIAKNCSAQHRRTNR